MIGIHVGIPNEAGPLNLYPWPSIVGAPRLWVNGNAVVLNAGNVRTWVDQGPEGNHIQQAAGASQPAYVVSDPNYGNKPTINFAGNKWMASLAFALGAITQPATVYIVGHSSSNVTDYRVFIDGITANRWIVTSDVGTGLIYSYAGSTLNTDRVGANPQIQCITLNNPTSVHYVNAYQSGNAGPNTIGTSPLDGITVGSVIAGAASFINGTVAEIIIFPGAHSAAQRLAMLQYLATRYNQPLNATTFGMRGWWLPQYGITFNGANVASWADQSGYGHHLIQATAANQPLWVASATKGKPGVRCDGITQFMKTAPFALNQPENLIMAYKQLSYGSAGVHDILIDGDTAGSMTLGTVSVNSYSMSSGAGVTYAGVAVANNVYAVAGLLWNSAAASTIRINGAQVATGNSGFNNAGGFTFGALGNLSRSANIEAAELQLFNVAVPATDRNQIEADMAANYV